MKEVKLTIDGKEVQLTDEQLRMLGIEPEKKRKNPFEEPRFSQDYYFTNECGIGKYFYYDKNDYDYGKLRNGANVFTNKHFAEQVALHQLLYRKLLKFAYDNECEDTAEWDGVNEQSEYLSKESLVACMNSLDIINTQQAEIERLKDEVSKARRKALLEASSKFAGHSDYHGDTILCKLICMSEGKEVGIAKPLDKSKIKSEAVKEFVKEHKEIMRLFLDDDDDEFLMKWCEYEVNTDNLVKEMVGDME